MTEENQMIKQIEDLKLSLRNMDEIFFMTQKIFSFDNIHELLDYIIARLVNKFTPENLVFIIKENFSSEILHHFAYSNLERVPSQITLESLAVYDDFFKKHPMPVQFELFEFMFGDIKLSDLLLPAEPEIIIPIMGISGLYGLILIGKKVPSAEYNGVELVFIDKLMKLTSLAVQNNVHYLNSVKDLKTGLYNHSYFMRQMYEEVKLAQLVNSTFTLLILDIDFFKKFNDNYGHMAGDLVLIHLANLLEQSVRAKDIVSRFGGEEFTIILSGCDRFQAFNTAERIRKAIEKNPLKYAEKSLSITISIGGYTCSKNNIFTIEEIIKKADTALYRAKDGGRNMTYIQNGGLLLEVRSNKNRSLKKGMKRSTDIISIQQQIEEI